MSAKPTILIVDDEVRITNILKINFRDKYNVRTANSGRKALEILESEPVNLVITDIRMPQMDGNTLIQKIKRTNPTLPIIVLTAYGSIENAIETIKQGAYDYIQKPINIEHLSRVIEKALEYNNVLQENRTLKQKLQKYEGTSEIITINTKMKKLLEALKQVAPTKVTVLLEGESGTGKEVFARTIYRLSDRADKPFVSINCGATYRKRAVRP